MYSVLQENPTAVKRKMETILRHNPSGSFAHFSMGKVLILAWWWWAKGGK